MTSGRRLLALGGAVFGLTAFACVAAPPASAGRAQIPGPPPGQTSPSAPPVAATASAPAAPLDSDGDGIPDDRDKCPHEPENYNGCNDDDGCPDKIVVIQPRWPFHINGRFTFDPGSTEVPPKLIPLLDFIAAQINANPDTGVIEVQGYSASNERHADKLAAARAREVVDRLVDRGVARDRLVVIAYGTRRALCTYDNEACFMLNRRVELNVPHPPPPPPPPPVAPGDCAHHLL